MFRRAFDPIASGPALLLISSALFASNAVLGRAAADTIPPVAMAFWRWTLAFSLVAPFALPGLFRARAIIQRNWWRLLTLGGLAMGICGANVYIGLGLTTATNTGLIYATSPVMIVVLAAIFDGEPLSAKRALGVSLAFAGVVVILARGEWAVLAGLAFNEGDLWILSGAIAWAVFTLLLRRWPMGLTTLELFAANAAAGVIALVPFVIWETATIGPVTWSVRAVALVAGVALFASVGAFLVYQKTVRVIGPARAGTALYIMPLWTAALAALWLGEAPHLYHLAGAALVLPGVTLANLRPKTETVR